MRTLVSRIPPPFLVFGALLLGWLLNEMVALPMAPPAFDGPRKVIGTVLIGLGIGLFASCLSLFKGHHTTLDPNGTASTLLTTGPYRVSRNPIYIALGAQGLGVALLGNSLWMLLALLVPIAVLQTIIIPNEERILLGVFGAAYSDYQARVHRWIGRSR